MDYMTGSENMMQSSSAAGPNNKFTTAKTLGLDYNYQEIGDEYRKDFLNESKSTVKKLTEPELSQMIENKLKYLRPKDFCLRMVLKMCFYL